MTIEELAARVGGEPFVSRWFVIDQARIDAFAEITEDRQFIHVDPQAARATPFGGTIAHGFLTLAMLSAFAQDARPKVSGVAMGVNYGFDRLRFLAPVPAGARMRGRFKLVGAMRRSRARMADEPRSDRRDRGRGKAGARGAMADDVRDGGLGAGGVTRT